MQGAHSGSKYCVYQHNESSEREKSREGGEGRAGDMEKAIFPLLLPSLLCSQPLW